MIPRDIVQKCPFCEVAYTERSITSLGSDGHLFRFHGTCASCGRSIMSFVTELAGWVSSVGMLTELTAFEAKQLPDRSLIDTDLCVRAHRVFFEHGREVCQFLQKQTKNHSPQRS